MPHFSPIVWISTGFIFYMLLLIFVSLFWWMQNFSFPSKLSISSSEFDSMWVWG